MGSIGKKVKKTVKKVAKPEVILPLALLAATGGGSAALGAFKGAGLKNILMNQAITAGLSKATTGEIDPKAQLLALGMSGLAGAAKPFTGAESIKQFGASTGLSKDASAALAQKLATNPAYVAPQTGLASIFDKGAQFAKAGFADPLSLKGAVTYGLPTAAGAMMGSPKTEEQKNLGVDPQAQYDLARLMNQKMGGAYTDEELNTLVAPMLSQYGGEYQTITGPKKERRPMFPGLNYSGLTRDVFVADGGSIKPKKRSKAVDEIVNEAEQREIILDALFGGVSPGANEEAMANQMFDLRRRQRLNPMGRKDGGLMQLASAPDPMDERNTMMENLALDKFGKSLDRLKDDEIIQIEEMIENMLPMANGGRIGMNTGGGLFERTRSIPEMFTTDELPSDPLSQIVKMGMAVRAPLIDVVEMLGLGVKETAGIVSDLVKQGYNVTEPVRDIAGDAITGAGEFLQEDAGDMGRFMSMPYYAQRFGGQRNLSDTETRLVRDLDSTVGRSTPERTEMLKEKLFKEIYGDNPVDKSSILLAPGMMSGKSKTISLANGGSIPQTKSIPAGMQLDGRGGGFIPMGAQEKKDDVPAMLAKNEFVMTSDAVKAAGGGDINKGAQKMYDLMNSLESKV